jgi:thiamine biosynthesis lipoprotein
VTSSRCQTSVAVYARQAADAAFAELDKIEAKLSRFIENSDISRLNNLHTGEFLLLSPDAFDCLELSARMYEQTNGAFDVTIGPLLTYWLNNDMSLRNPLAEELAFARQRSGMHLLKLDHEHYTVELRASPVQIDLGGIGKGYAVDRMAELLRQWSIDTALIHGGFSSVLALDPPAGTAGWPVTLSHPRVPKETLAKLFLRRRALGASGLKKGRHIIDPRTAQPVKNVAAAWSCAADAAIADALSTAFMVMSPAEIEQYCLAHPDTSSMVIPAEDKSQQGGILRFGHFLQAEP